ncbi:MAG: DUF262 domain-containing protein [Phycisphaerae bacterium]
MIIDLTLEQIAAWTDGSATGKRLHSCVAKPPSLQRGLVWKPGQIELLWDSILRGFPFGSLVVCKKLENQRTRGADAGVTHHLLDGQQRAHAIALGFLDDPFQYVSSANHAAGKTSMVLWIDLHPHDLAKSGTRQFLFRLTTQTHPWGYDKYDHAARLGISAIRDSLHKCGRIITDEPPGPDQCWPHESEVPVPFAWLMTIVAADTNIQLDGFLEKLQIKAKLSTYQGGWLDNAMRLLAHPSSDEKADIGVILESIRRAMAYRTVAFVVPEKAMEEASQQESGLGDAASAGVDIANIEHLFQRLNSGGTPLAPEDLAYSMIKAYWPEFEQPISRLAEKRMPESRLAVLAARTALARISTSEQASVDAAIPGPLSISELRRIARSENPLEMARRKKVIDFFADGPAGLAAVINRVSVWTGTGGDHELDIGLPAVLHTAIARNSAEVYLLLMCWARRTLEHPMEGQCGDAISKRILGLATVLHWFALDKQNAASDLMETIIDEEGLTEQKFAGVLHGKNGSGTMIAKIFSPDELGKLIILPKGDAINNWRWQNLAAEFPEQAATGNNITEIESNLLPFLWRLISNRELLLYAQRAFLKERFQNYDPARQDRWADKDRPWDFDHILPWGVIYHRKGVPDAIRAWTSCIANLRAWPLAENRSDTRDRPMEKIRDDKAMADSFVTPEELAAFDCGFDFRQPGGAEMLLNAARSRLLRIYVQWYNALDIGYLTGAVVSA